MNARAFPLAVACLLAITSRTAGQDVSGQAESLRGLDGLYLIGSDLNDQAQEGGLTEDALQTYLEMRLRQARIPVLSTIVEWLATERQPYLYLNILALQTARGWAYTLRLEVKQLACPEGRLLRGDPHGGGCSGFTTWDVGVLSITPDNLADSVRGNLAELMDQLVNDYLAMNP